MSTFLPAPWEERVARLHLGIEPVDALDRSVVPSRPPSRVSVHLERVPLPCSVPPDPGDDIGLPQLRPSRTGRFAVSFGSPVTDPPPRLDVRIVDPDRRYVPRRLSAPVPTLAEVLAAEDGQPKPPRALRAALYRRAYAPLPPGTTALVGQATWPSGRPTPWVRVDVALPAVPAASPWLAQGDESGAFVVVVGSLPQQLAAALTGVLEVVVTVRGRPEPNPGDPVDSPARSRADPLWFLPVEQVTTLDGPDGVADGTSLPPGYTTTASRAVQCARGAVTRLEPLVLT